MNNLISGCEEVKSLDKFYSDGEAYWKTISPDINGMLGGFSHISNIDVEGSKDFLRHFFKGCTIKIYEVLNSFHIFLSSGTAATKTNYALDCGSGIGRISKHLLLPIFDKVDLLELNQDFLNQANEYIGPKLNTKLGKLICSGMQNVELNKNYYDVIWLQWVTGHLIDEHFVKFLKKCKSALKENGLIIIKDNITVGGIELDKVDSSVTRSQEALKSICKMSDLTIIKEDIQKNFPACIYSVIILALC